MRWRRAKCHWTAAITDCAPSPAAISALATRDGAGDIAGRRRVDDALHGEFRGVADDRFDSGGVDGALAGRVKRELLDFATREAAVGAEAGDQQLAGVRGDFQTMAGQHLADHGLQRLRVVGKAGDRGGGRGFLEH